MINNPLRKNVFIGGSEMAAESYMLLVGAPDGK
jgi:hypothetical protein